MTNIWTKTEIKPDCVLTSFLRIVSYELAFLISARISPLAILTLSYNTEFTEQNVTIASRKVEIVRTNVSELSKKVSFCIQWWTQASIENRKYIKKKIQNLY